MRTLMVSISVLGCLAASGCGNSYPYYTLEGSAESREVVVHVDENTQKRVPCGTAMGGGLTAEHKARLAAGEEVKLEKNGVTVTVGSKIVPVVTEVVYDGEEIKFHEPIL